VLNEPIRDGYGRLSLGDTVWRVAGPDLPAGQKVRVISADGAVLKVESAGA
jgi:membrane protein implicated in regulation of membrane protease activity